MGKLIIEIAKFVIFTALMAIPHQSKTWAHRPKPKSKPTWATTVTHGRERTTTLQFYFHDVVTGKSPTAVQVVPPKKPGSSTPFSGFGFIRMIDDPLTVGHDPKSKLVGRAQGMYGRASQEDYTLLMAVVFNFLDGVYNGSSFSVLARNTLSEPVREFPVIGGTGFFRMARGYALTRTYFRDVATRNAIVGYNVTIIH